MNPLAKILLPLSTPVIYILSCLVQIDQSNCTTGGFLLLINLTRAILNVKINTEFSRDCYGVTVCVQTKIKYTIITYLSDNQL